MAPDQGAVVKDEAAALAAKAVATAGAAVAMFGKSTLLRLFNAGDTAGAAEQLGRWVLAGGKRMRGLERRRADERRLFEGEQ